MAQFSHPELGGMGQWSRGGMIMIGDMFNNGLKSRVDALCNDLSQIVGRDGLVALRPQSSSQYQYQGGQYQGGNNGGDYNRPPLPASSFFVNSGNWWPAELGLPASSGGQNNMRYACFPERQRLAVDIAGQVSVYDTGLHWISGFSQQQSGDQSVTFTSQYGTIRLESLPLISGPGMSNAGSAPSFTQPTQNWQPQNTPAPTNTSNDGDIFASIERLGSLRDKGFISDAEFMAKKTELLQRL
jgi:hypothetical protein